MSIYLNTDKALENYKKLLNSPYFVDKSMIIQELNSLINTSDGYVCITRPRRFGKTSVVDMLGAYYSRAVDSKAIFDKLEISTVIDYEEHLNQYNVIQISFNRLPDKGNGFEDYMDMIKDSLIQDICQAFPKVKDKKYFNIADQLYDTGEKFIFILDEWDYIFSNHLFEEHQNDFLEFLRNLLKDQPYVALCYMTGVLPIKKYSSGSALNMFDEYTMLSDTLYGEYFGFTESEVKELCSKQKHLTFDELKEWYNGYCSGEEIQLYNPRSVVKALKNHKCKSYWTSTGAMNEVSTYLKYNILEVRDDVIKMIAKEPIQIWIDEEFRAGQEAPRSKEEIYSAMIILGFLSYNDGVLKIPNKELMREFEKALRDESFGYVSQILQSSELMLKATLDRDEKAVEDILHGVHNSEIPILQYNDENSLACVVTLAYLSARDFYRVEREEKTGKGYADFTFHPRGRNEVAFIVELKKDESPEVAIEQIKEKEYVEKFRRENIDNPVLAVAICYDSKKKEHKCKIEEIKIF